MFLFISGHEHLSILDTFNIFEEMKWFDLPFKAMYSHFLTMNFSVYHCRWRAFFQSMTRVQCLLKMCAVHFMMDPELLCKGLAKNRAFWENFCSYLKVFLTCLGGENFADCWHPVPQGPFGYDHGLCNFQARVVVWGCQNDGQIITVTELCPTRVTLCLEHCE